jgi:hypothetical protein
VTNGDQRDQRDQRKSRVEKSRVEKSRAENPPWTPGRLSLRNQMIRHPGGGPVVAGTNSDNRRELSVTPAQAGAQASCAPRTLVVSARDVRARSWTAVGCRVDVTESSRFIAQSSRALLGKKNRTCDRDLARSRLSLLGAASCLHACNCIAPTSVTYASAQSACVDLAGYCIATSLIQSAPGVAPDIESQRRCCKITYPS